LTFLQLLCVSLLSEQELSRSVLQIPTINYTDLLLETELTAFGITTRRVINLAILRLTSRISSPLCFRKNQETD
jgi:hypothetical protein